MIKIIHNMKKFTIRNTVRKIKNMKNHMTIHMDTQMIKIIYSMRKFTIRNTVQKIRTIINLTNIILLKDIPKKITIIIIMIIDHARKITILIHEKDHHYDKFIITL